MLPKKVKKTLNPYPTVKGQNEYPHGYDGRTTPKRRQQLAEFITEDGTFLPKSVLHEDLDLGMLEFVKDKLESTINGKQIPVIDRILTAQRWGEFTQTWKFSDLDKNIKIPFISVVRRPDVNFGSNPSLKYTIPNRKQFHYAKVPTWDGQRKGMDLYKIPQPVPVDIMYDVRVICNRMREVNLFNRVVMQRFTSRQAYTFVKGHYIPIVLESITDGSQLTDLESRKFYSQTYQFQMQGFLIDEEEFEISPAISRTLSLFEVNTKVHKREKHKVPEGDNPRTIFIGLSFGDAVTTAYYLFDFPCKIEIDEALNIGIINNVFIKPQGSAQIGVSLPLYINSGDLLQMDITKSDVTEVALQKLKVTLD